MAASPRWKCYDADGTYQGSVKDLVLAAALMSILGEGSTVRDGFDNRRIVYTEGTDGECGDSYDAVVKHVEDRE